MTKSVEKVGVFHRNCLPASSPVLLTLITICEEAAGMDMDPSQSQPIFSYLAHKEYKGKQSSFLISSIHHSHSNHRLAVRRQRNFNSRSCQHSHTPWNHLLATMLQIKSSSPNPTVPSQSGQGSMRECNLIGGEREEGKRNVEPNNRSSP